MRPSPRRSSSARRGLVGMVIGVLLFSGVPLAAWSAPTPTPTPSATPAGKVEAQDDATPKAETTPEADAGEATPSATAEETPTEDSTPGDDESAGNDPSDESSESATPEDEESASESADPSASASATPSRTPSGRVVAQVVPPATGNDAVITVKVGGNRTSLNAINGLAGLQLALYANAGDTTPVTGFTSTCTSDADGDCSFTVPNTQPGGANRDRRFWVKEVTSPAGFRANDALVTGPDGGPFSTTPYRFQTGTQLRNGSTYATTGVNASFMLGTGNAVPTASGGIWQSSRTNPAFPAECGLRVALVLDVSGSVSGSLPQLKTAANTFVNSLVGTPSSVGLFTFAATAPAPGANNVNRPVTAVSTTAGAATVNGWINGVSAGGTTNWDRGIYQVAQSAATFDIAVVITDGNPTVYGNTEGPGNFTRFREVENGIFSANAVKAEDTRMVAVGVGAGISAGAANLQAISGPTVNSDYYQTTNYAQAGEALRALALGNCEGSVSVVKQVIPAGGTTAQAAPAGGWTMTTSAPSAGVTVTPPVSGQTANGTGAINFPLTFAGGTTTGQLTVTETQQTGYTLVQQGALNATCSRINPDTGATSPVTVTNVGTTGFRTDVNEADPVSCIVFNRAPNPPASVVLNKTWVVNGTTYAEGSQPPGLIASGQIDGTGQPWGAARTGFSEGDTVALDETLNATPRQCVLVSSRLTSANDAPVDLALPANQTLVTGANTYGITNTLTCQTRLTLDKSVQFGPASPDEWTLDALAPDGALPGPNGVAGSPGATGQAVTPAVRYPLAESGGPLEYAQVVAPNANPIPGSTGSWTCQEVGTDGTTVIPGFADGLNGGVTVPFGTWVRCTAVNQTATLRLVKEVVNDNGGTAVPAAWDLSATPAGTFPPDLPVVTQPGAAVADAVSVNVRPGVRYDLSESDGPAGYENTRIQCQVTAPRADTTFIQLDPGDVAICYFTNDDQPASLTLIKTVDNDNGGDANETDWTLTATGPTPGVTGTTGSDAVTDAEVSAGSYDLTESGGPAGYTAGDWSCTGGALTGATVVVPTGGDVECRINNNDQPAELTLVKVVENGTTGGTAGVTDWTLNADGPTPIDGVTGDPSVTDATVDAGTYALGEAGPAGYAAGSWACTGGTVTGASLTVPLAGDVTCTITNTAIPARLTLVKTVDNDNGGTAEATDWALTATGPTAGVTGATGSSAVTDIAVLPGSYTLSETGPDGYTASAWTCVDADDEPVTVAGSAVTIALGEDVTCTIVNTAIPPSWSIIKLSDPESGSTVQPGDEITYLVGLIRNAGSDPTDVVVTDDLSAVLANATLVDGPTASTGTASVTGTTMTWTVPVLSEEVEFVAYTVRVNPAAYGVTLRNVITSPGSVPCVPEEDSEEVGGLRTQVQATRAFAVGASALTEAAVRATAEDDELCPTTTEHFTPAWSLAKTSDPESGSTVDPGDQITYTLTVTNTTENAVVDDAVVTDDLSDVLQYASLDSVPSGATVSGETLTWNVPELQPGESVGLSYTVTVDDDAYDAAFGNVATPGDGGECTTCTTTHDTPPEPDNPDEPKLPNTGGTSLVPLGLGVGFLVIGAVLLAESRRRRQPVRVRIDPKR